MNRRIEKINITYQSLLTINLEKKYFVKIQSDKKKVKK